MILDFFTFLQQSFIEPIVVWLKEFVVNYGVVAPAILLILEEGGIPLPIPGDIYIAYTGYLVSKGEINYFSAFILLLICSLIGSSILYFLAYKYGQKLVLKFGKYINLDEKKLFYVEGKFRKYGVWVIIFGRHVPGFRIAITIFAGMSKVKYSTFIISTAISTAVWIIIYLYIGQQVGMKILHLFQSNHGYILLIFIPLILATIFILYNQVQVRRRKKEAGTKEVKRT